MKSFKSLMGTLIACTAMSATSAPAQVIAPEVKNVAIPGDVDAFSLDLDGIRKYSSASNFEVLGHSYFKVPERTPWAKAQGRPGKEVGGGFNTVRVYDGIAYLAGYNYPATFFGVLIADVRDPKNIKPLSTIPCNPSGRCTYLRVNKEKKILAFGHDSDRDNPNKVKPGEQTNTGWSFYDVADPAKPKEIAFVPATMGGKTHGMDMDDKYVYGCGTFANDMNREGLQIIDYSDPKNIHQVATWHVTGQVKGETYGPLNQAGPDGKPQLVQCHEVVYYNDKLYLGWRDGGMIILDVKDRAHPREITTYDYVPPFHGGFLGAAHTAMPVVVNKGEDPDIVVATDEIFDCPQGFGRIFDVSDLKNPDVAKGKRAPNIQILSTFRAAHTADKFDPVKKEFVCEAAGGPNGTLSNTTHLPFPDKRSPSLVYVTWYDEGVRAMDITNPAAPVFTGYYLSPRFASPGRVDRHTREIWQDPDTELLYTTDGNGGGMTVLRYTGPVSPNPPIPGAR
ncbi:MAG: hypothetical protein JWO64_3688 [Hyphomicrobiales bacterium]|nr:hypothetical protein [Hyphomicrobiales bacterium]